MFDGLIFRILDKIVTTYEHIKEYMIKRSLPKPNKDELKNWVKQRKNDYK